MFEKKALMFLYSVSPVHMGAGTALGPIDSPVQRERHTNHPVLPGSGIKGALRHEASRMWEEAGQDERIQTVFGPEPGAGDDDKRHAGAVSFGDGQIVLFPVRSLRQGYVYAASPVTLNRLKRALALVAPEEVASWPETPVPEDGHCYVTQQGASSLLVDQGGKGSHLILEAYDFHGTKDESGLLDKVGGFLAKTVLPSDKNGFKEFAKAVRERIVLLPEEVFRFFVENAVMVEPHVRISDETGTAEDGGLFYVENVPPEALFFSVVMASQERRASKGEGEGKKAMAAAEVLSLLSAGPDTKPGGFDGAVLQIGGDATTGRGLMLTRFYGGKA